MFILSAFRYLSRAHAWAWMANACVYGTMEVAMQAHNIQREHFSCTHHMILHTSHCCSRFAVDDVFGIGSFLRNMAHMSNMFSDRVGTKGWSQYYKQT